MSSLRPVSGTAGEILGLLREWDAAEDPEPLVIETSGSTGSPKRVVLSRAAMRASALATQERLGGPGRWVLNLPPTYVAGVQVLYRSVVAGTEPLFDDEYETLPAGRTFISLVPTQLFRALEDGFEVRDLARFEAVLVGGGPLSPVVRAEAEGYGIRIVQTYGMSETCGGCVYDGRPLAGVEIRIGEDEEILLRGPMLFDGYENDPERTSTVMQDGWFRTSDAGRIDENGRMWVTGRLDDVIISGGVKVPGAAVADRLKTHPFIEDAVVLGVPDEEWGERVVAFVVHKQSRSRSAEAALELACSRAELGAEAVRRVRGDPPPAQRQARPDEAEGLAVKVFSIPLRTRFRGITEREGVLVEGAAGWGEFSPFLEYDAATAAPWLDCAREAADVGWPDPVRDSVPVNVTVPACSPERAREIVLASAGCRTAKVKVAEPGQDPGEDEARLEAVRDAIGADGLVRIDANGAWSVDEAISRIGLLERAAGGLEYVEQPVASVEDLAVVRRRVDVPIAADESIRRAADPYRVRDLEAADIAVLKVQPLGGVRACLRIAEDIGLPVVVSSAVESSIGIAAGVALAAALPELPHACGLATVQLLTGDVVADPLLPVDGALPVRRPTVDAERLATLTASPERIEHWRQRMAEVVAVRQDRRS